MKKLLLTIVALTTGSLAFGQSITARWELSDKDNLSAVTLSGDEVFTSLVTAHFEEGANIGATATRVASDADTGNGYQAVAYDPYFTEFKPKTRVTGKTAGHCIRFTITPTSGYVFRPTGLSFDGVKCGTDGGNIGVYSQIATGGETTIAASLTPLRNKVAEGNLDAYSHYDYQLSGVSVNSKAYHIYLYIWNLNGIDNANPKSIAFRNVTLTGEVEKFYTAADFVNSITCQGTAAYGEEGQRINLTALTKDLTNGGLAKYDTKLYGDPTDFVLSLKDGYTSTVEVSGHVAFIKILKDGKKVFDFEVLFVVSNRAPKPAAKPLNRGLMSLSLSGAGMGTGNLVSWRAREADGKNVKFKLYRGTNATTQNTKVNSGKFITGKTNFNDANGTASSYYRLEVYDADGNLLESEVSRKTWSNQNWQIPLSAAPVDLRNNATYTPNDASICDMDGDGEYDIILKWSPSNEKDAASNGTTSQAVYDCYKMDGTQLWRIQTGYNMFNSAHSTPFIAWDFDGDGYGEFMVKTAPGAIDGEGNYVLLGSDDPNENLLSSRGKQDHGSEYITVFDGTTGAELATIPYHTDYAAGLSYWGDEKQNRSERYLAAIGWLDGPDKNPSPIFARGYYRGAFVAAYDWDGVTLKERWVSRHTTSGKGLWGEGAHWISVGDCNGDGKQDIVYGSAALKHDGSLLYRTGLHHGDALHLGDFDTEHPGLEVFMVHEESPYGYDLRDAATGEFILHETAGGDTGRGLIGHFDPEAASAYFQHSAAMSNLYDIKGNVIANNISHGGGGSLNNRIYWNGDLADDYYDKSVLEYWNSEAKGFWRMSVNGGNYTIGNLNNSSKYNPCVLGDVLGDWREEIINWQENGGKYYLVINATSYQTDYILPHLMDDLNYRAQVINQNCAYNQPPHLSYDPIVRCTIEREMKAYDVVEDGKVVSKYWDSFYTAYPVRIPENVTAWAVSNYSTDGTDVVRLTKLTGKAIPANRGVIVKSDDSKAVWRPTTISTTAVSATYLNGCTCDSTLVCDKAANEMFYEFRDGERGLGFYLADGKTVEGGTAFLRIKASASVTLADSYILGNIAPSPVAVNEVTADDGEDMGAAIHTLQGVRTKAAITPGVYIKGKKKVYVK